MLEQLAGAFGEPAGWATRSYGCSPHTAALIATSHRAASVGCGAIADEGRIVPAREADERGRETLIQSSRAVGLGRGWINIHSAHTSKNVLQGQLNFAVVDSCAGDLTESPVPQASVRFGKLGRVERVEEFNTEL
jgi:hypothetical protein